MSTATQRPTDPAAAGPLRKGTGPTASAEPDDDHDVAPLSSPDDVAPAVRPPRLPWILAVLGLIGTLGFGLAWMSARDGGSGAGTATEGSSELLKAAKGFSKDLTNFDGATIDRDFDRITAQATGDFRSQADQFFSSDVRSQLKKAQASSRGEVRSAYVQTVDGDRGTVFVVVDQTIANNASPQPQADTLRMELGLVQRDGAWKVERVSVLTAPSGGTTGAAAGEPSGN